MNLRLWFVDSVGLKLGCFFFSFLFLGWGDMGPFVVPGLLVVVFAGSAFKLIARKGTGEKLEESLRCI